MRERTAHFLYFTFQADGANLLDLWNSVEAVAFRIYNFIYIGHSHAWARFGRGLRISQ